MSGFDAAADNSVLNATTLLNQLATANVTVTTGSGGTQSGDITVAAPLSWTAATTLTLNAARNITVNAPISFGGTAGAGLTLTAGQALQVNSNITVNGAGAVSITTGNRAILNASGGTAATIEDYAFGNGASISFRNADGSAASTTVAGQSLTINTNAYTLVYSMAQLDAIDGQDGVSGAAVSVYGAGVNGRYALARSLDASGTTYSRPVLSANSQFSGTFTGLGNIVSSLTISSPSIVDVGLFGVVIANGTVRDLGLVGGDVTASTSSPTVGALVGTNYGVVAQSSASTSVSGLVGAASWAGGLVGLNNGVITRSWATGAVAAGNGSTTRAGGLVGANPGLITESFAMGSITGGANARAGGLVGLLLGSVVQSFATGRVSAGTNAQIGGLAGGLAGTPTIASSAWDTQTSGVSVGVGSGSATGTTGLTTAQFQNGTLPTGFDAAAWGAGAGSTLSPVGLSHRPAGGEGDRLSRRRYGGSARRATVGIASGASLFASATTGADGAFYAFGSPGALTNGQALVAFTGANALTGARNAATLTSATGARSRPA